MSKEIETNSVIAKAIEKNIEKLSIYTGSALPEREPEQVLIKGNINAVADYLTLRKDKINQHECHIIVDREARNIGLTVNEHSPYKDYIAGRLQIHPLLEKWDINSGATWVPKQAAEFIKMNRTCFAEKSQAMKLSKELADIKVKVSKEVEKSDNNRGDYKSMIAQKVIASNIPETFQLSVPIFKGSEPTTFEVEIYVSPVSFECAFVSPELNEVIEQQSNSMIDAELEAIRTIAPDIVIIER